MFEIDVGSSDARDARKTSTVKTLNLLPDDARDLIHGLQWAFGQRLSEGKFGEQP